MLKSKMTGVSPTDADRHFYLDSDGQVLMIDDWWWKFWWPWVFDEHGMFDFQRCEL
jgi:hypothetical protein